jgi:hypothetical protein
MTVAQWIDNLNMPMPIRLLFRTYIVTKFPDALGAELAVKVHQEDALISMCLNGEPFLVKTFNEVEEFFNTADEAPQPAEPEQETLPDEPDPADGQVEEIMADPGQTLPENPGLSSDDHPPGSAPI